MLPLRHLPRSQRNELTKLRVLTVLSDPATATYGLSAAKIIREVGAVGCENTNKKLLKEMEAEGLIDHRIVDPQKTVGPLVITPHGIDHLAAAKRSALFPQIGGKQEWQAEEDQSYETHLARLAEMDRRKSVRPMNLEHRKLQVLQVLSDPATAQYGSSLKVIQEETGIGAISPLLSVLEAEGLIERKPYREGKAARFVFITARGSDHLAAAKERGDFPETGRPDAAPEGIGTPLQALLTFISSLPEFNRSSAERRQEIAEQLHRLIESPTHDFIPPDSDSRLIEGGRAPNPSGR
jgi:DNA-binding PadR family transcriptional regulator